MLLIMVFFKVTEKYIFQLTKSEHKGVSESIDSDNRNFSSLKPQQIFRFFKQKYFIPGVLLKGSDLYFRYFDAICIYINSHNKKQI